MLISTALKSGFIMAAILTTFILLSLARKPRIWLIWRGTPEAIRATVTPPLMDSEKRLLKLWAIPIFAIILIMPLGAAFWYEATYQPMSYGEAFLFIYLMANCFNLVDLLIIDWFVLLWWQPDWSIIPEVKALMQHLGYAYHFKGFLKGTVMLAVFALIYAGIVLLF